MGRRFAKLEEQYIRFSAIDFNFESLPADDPLRNYADWKTNLDKRVLPQASRQARDRSVTITLTPFGFGDANAVKYSKKMSGRAFSYYDGLSGKAVFGIEEDTAGIKPYPSYKPAKAVIALRRSSPLAVSKAQNRITGQAYKRYSDESYTIPFGITTANKDEFTAQDAILAGFDETHAVSFTPEKLERRLS